MNLIPITIVDDFFENPDVIREEALKLNFESGHNCPGVRAFCPPNVCNLVSKKIFSLLIDMNRHVVSGELNMYFQLTNDKYKEGWVHFDGSTYFAGVIYLSPNAPIEGGTAFYRLQKGKELEDQGVKEDIYRGASSDIQSFEAAQKQNNSNYYKTIEVGNIYNRLVMYPGDEFHSENKLFGSTKEDSRLTLVFFAKQLELNTLFPINRMKLVN